MKKEIKIFETLKIKSVKLTLIFLIFIFSTLFIKFIFNFHNQNKSFQNLYKNNNFNKNESIKNNSQNNLSLDNNLKYNNLKKVALTFDDGPSLKTLDILSILEMENIKATFFVIGKNVEKYPEIVKRLQGEGHQIGNHSYSHSPLLYRQSKSNILKEMNKTNEIIKQTIATGSIYFRPPYGLTSPNMQNILTKNNYKIIMWTVDPRDWDIKNNPSNIEKMVLENVKDKDIVLFHDGKSVTESADLTDENTEVILRDLIQKLKAQNYEFVTIDELYKGR